MVAPGKLANIAVFDTDLVGVGETDLAKPLEARVRHTVVGAGWCTRLHGADTRGAASFEAIVKLG